MSTLEQRPRRTRSWAPLIAGLVALGLALGAALLILMWQPDPAAASARLAQARPVFLMLQICALTLAWHFWPQGVHWFGRKRGWGTEAQDALIQGRTRIFMLLGAMEVLILLRALA